jgi:hypothetical protein
MKKIYTIASCLLLLGACKKKDTTTCYECQMDPANTNYTAAGCYTQEEWNQKSIADFNGTVLDKNVKCRVKQ